MFIKILISVSVKRNKIKPGVMRLTSWPRSKRPEWIIQKIRPPAKSILSKLIAIDLKRDFAGLAEWFFKIPR